MMDLIGSDGIAFLTAVIAAFAMIAALWFAMASRCGPLRLTPMLGFVGAAIVFINGGFLSTFLVSSDSPADYRAIANVSLGLICVAAGGLITRSLVQATP